MTTSTAQLWVQTVAGRVVHIASVNDGKNVLQWNARWHRKARSSARGPTATKQRFYARAVGVLFAIGAACFVVAAPIALSRRPGADALNLVGSLLFSLGAVYAVLEANGAAKELSGARQQRFRTTAALAATVQLVSAAGVFQISTIAASADVSGSTALFLVWVPSFLGGIGFAWSGWLYAAEARPAHDLGSRIANLNLAGSVIFLLSAVPGLVDPDEALAATRWLTALGYGIGSLAFLCAGVAAVFEVSRSLPQGSTSIPAQMERTVNS
ncbi:hypothetical protein [Microbacterium halophytorum]|uniref:hypothetical protein n=1 Tax=Microbacterium halophytorum TaxID=2067568 RepID=UPI001319F9D8|nr:hypothetical protein [Microbacterium halophytorum]